MHEINNVMSNKTVVWDCDSALYDSFEIRSFKRQLDATISSRTFSMPRLSEPQSGLAPPSLPQKQRSNKLARSLGRLIRAVFRRKIPSSLADWNAQHGLSGNYSLSTIPEVCEMAIEYSPEFDPWAVRRGSRIGSEYNRRATEDSGVMK